MPVGDGITEIVTFKTIPSIQDSSTLRFLRLKLIE